MDAPFKHMTNGSGTGCFVQKSGLSKSCGFGSISFAPKSNSFADTGIGTLSSSIAKLVPQPLAELAIVS